MMASGSAVQVKGLGILIRLGGKTVDSRLKIDNAVEDPALEPLPGQSGEKASTALSQKADVNMKWSVTWDAVRARWDSCASHVVDDRVEVPRGRGLAVDLVERMDEFLVPMARHALADDPAVEHIEGSE
jgi:hypothetical protein